MSSPRRILIVRLSHLGDVCHALPVFHALRASEPEARLAWVVQPEFAGVLEGLPGLERVFPFDRRGGWRAWRDLRDALREWAPDQTVDAQGNFKSAFAARLSGAARRSGLHRADWTERHAALLCNDRAPERALGTHAMDRMFALARHVAPGFRPEDARLDPVVSAEDLEAAEIAWVRRVGADAATILAPGDPSDVRSWPVERCAELARRESAEGRGVLVLTGPGEREVGERLAGTLRTYEHVRHWIGQSGQRELAAFFTVAAARGARLVSRDGGTLHLAVACGLRAIALHGPQDPRRTGPWPVPLGGAQDRHRLVAAAQPPACSPCLRRTCTHERGPVCMTELDVERVLAALRESREARTVAV